MSQPRKSQPFRATRRGEGQMPPQEGAESEGTSTPCPSPVPPPCPSPTPGAVYTAEEFFDLRTCLTAVRPIVRQWAGALWDQLDEARPEHMKWSREGMFQSDTTTGHGRQYIIKDRKLRNEVLGVLTRVTADNYAAIEQQLLALPIRQSDEDEINEVIKMIFEKAINPVDQVYVTLYVKLICALVTHIGEHPVGAFIRKAMVTNCQHKFSDNPILKQELDTTGLDADEAAQKRENTVQTLKANLSFLGLLFVNGFVSEKVVCFVLYQLIFGNPDPQGVKKKRRSPADYEVDLFVELFMCTSPKLTTQTLKYLPSFRNAMEDVAQTHKSKRIQFKAEDMLVFMQRETFADFRAKPEVLTVTEQQRESHRSEMRRAEELQRQTDQRRNAPQTRSELSKKVLTQELLRDGLARCISDPSEIASLRDTFEKCSNPTAIERFLAEGMWRMMTTVKLTSDRAALPQTVTQLTSTASMKRIFSMHAEHWIESHGYEEHKLYYASWVTMVNASSATAGVCPDLLFTLLEVLIRARPSVPGQVNKYLAEVQKGYSGKEPVLRFRPLPFMLEYVPIPAEEGEEPLGEDPKWNLDADILDLWEASNSDAQVFQMLVRGESLQNENLLGSLSVVSSLFAFYRFALVDPKAPDVPHVVQRCADVLRAWRPPRQAASDDAAVFVEAFLTWRAFDCRPAASFEVFCMGLMDHAAPKGRGPRLLQCTWDTVRHAVQQAGGKDAEVAFMRTRPSNTRL